MLIIDAHLDLAWSALQWNRNLLESVYTVRANEAKVTGKGRAQNTVCLLEMQQGRVAVSFVTMLARSTGQKVEYLDYGSQTQAFGIAKGQLAYYRALETDGHARILEDGSGLRAHIAEWEAWESGGADPLNAPQLGFVISMEGADPIRQPAQLEEWWDAGLRLLGPTHYGPGRYAGGTGVEQGLTALGAPLLREMNRLGMLLDLTHMSDIAFWQAVKIYDGPVLASHNNCRALVPHQRQFSDEQLNLIIERDGVIGAAFDIWMLQPGFVRGGSNQGVFIETVIDHIDHICQLSGNSLHAAIGTDLDGGFGREQSPRDLDTIADLQQLPAKLAARGYQADDIANIMHGNWLRFLYGAWS
ncbi:MAG: membrane dipeptidase [Chloroflexota bacterium]|nr:membrane dipeptidase [Chloroflexota bacterium]